MKRIKSIISIILIPLYANFAFAANFYLKKIDHSSVPSIYLGDSTFSYEFSRSKDISQETFTRNLTKIKIERGNGRATMLIEQKTRTGLLYLTYVYKESNWENSKITFRKYSRFFKYLSVDGPVCETQTPTKNNQADINSVNQSLEKDIFSVIAFDKGCHDKMGDDFKNLVDATYALLYPEKFDSPVEPKIINCIQNQGANGMLFAPYNTAKEKILLALRNPDKENALSNDSSVPFPISCDFKSTDPRHCASLTENKKDKISLDVNCLTRSKNAFRKNSQETVMHEFAHSAKFSEKQISEFEKGNCNPMDIMFVPAPETDISKNKIIAEENAKSTGAQKIAGDVANPYSSFAERATTPAAAQTTNIASNESSSGATEVAVGSGSSSVVAQQRSIASTNAFNVSPSNTSSNSNYSIPSIQQQAQYQNVKTYVDASVNTVAKKIAPIVSYVESPAFAQTLPPTSFENGNRGDTSAAVGTAAATVAKSAATNKAAATTGRTGEVASGSSSGSSGEIASGNTANLGGSSSSSGSRSPAAVNKNANRLSSDPGLDNAYALKVRKKLLSDNAYRTELRNKGVQIEFADGYKFETPSSKVLYTEKNGVLVRGK